MKTRLQYIALFIILGVATYGSTKLWALVPYGSLFDPLAIIFSFVLGLFTIISFIKIFKVRTSFINIIADIAIGIWP